MTTEELMQALQKHLRITVFVGKDYNNSTWIKVKLFFNKDDEEYVLISEDSDVP